MTNIREQRRHLANSICVALVLMMAVCFILSEYFLVISRVQRQNGKRQCFNTRDVITSQSNMASSFNVTMPLSKTTKEKSYEDVSLKMTKILEANSSVKFRNRTETPLYLESETLEPLRSIFEAQQSFNVSSKSIFPYEESVNRFPKSAKDSLINCEELNLLFKKYSQAQSKGTVDEKDNESYLRVDDKDITGISVVSFVRKKSFLPHHKLDPMKVLINRDPRNYDNTDFAFETAKESLHKLLRMQGWPGIPRIFVACVLTANGSEIQLSQSSHSLVHSIRYAIEVHKQGTPLCRPRADDCTSFQLLLSFIKSLPKPAISALKIMKSFALIFESFIANGIYPAELALDTAIVTQQFEVLFTSVDHLMFMDRTSTEESKYKRLLSDTSCRFGYQCPTRDLYGDDQNTRFCQEFRGHCGLNSRCWGLDANSHLCVLANTLFPLLSEVVRSSWKQPSSIDAIVTCGAQNLPEFRCDWAAFRISIEALLGQAAL